MTRKINVKLADFAEQKKIPTLAGEQTDAFGSSALTVKDGALQKVVQTKISNMAWTNFYCDLNKEKVFFRCVTLVVIVFTLRLDF